MQIAQPNRGRLFEMIKIVEPQSLGRCKSSVTCHDQSSALTRRSAVIRASPRHASPALLLPTIMPTLYPSTIPRAGPDLRPAPLSSHSDAGIREFALQPHEPPGGFFPLRTVRLGRLQFLGFCACAAAEYMPNAPQWSGMTSAGCRIAAGSR